MLRRPTTTSAVIVDDWPLVRVGAARVLQTIDVRLVGEADTAVEGIRIAKSVSADLLVVGEPLDGQQVEAVRLAKGGCGARVAVLVTQATRDQLAALLEAGADGLVSRSVGTDDLADILSRVLDGERVVAPSLMPALVGMLSKTGADRLSAADNGDGPLTLKELEVLRKLSEGLSNREIADAVFVTTATVKTHLAHIYAKLGVGSRHEALAKAVALGLLS